MSPGSSTESYPVFARTGLRENPGKNLNQVTCPDRDSNPGHLVSRPDALTVTPQLPKMSPKSDAESNLALAFNGKTPEKSQPGNLFQAGFDSGLATFAGRHADHYSNTKMEEIIVGGRRKKCIRFADDMALLAEEKVILKDMLLELNASCEQHGMKMNTLRRSEEKRIEAFEMLILRRMERVKWTDRIRNEAVLKNVVEERMTLKLIRKRKENWLGHWLRRNCLLKDTLEGMVNERRVPGRRRYQVIDDIKIYGSYDETKRKAENRKDWRKLGLQ
ncbi:hypothetical protein ANN_23755 [Periplaneta americana]|uniref:Uncharacterized protein n=1 Tax=Periplaneta americana TaxID=6978 RepID=A0ABQ8SLY3_PERAM|nr:hypothetical protein ANN_23755 [Periplaneta americana]